MVLIYFFTARQFQPNNRLFKVSAFIPESNSIETWGRPQKSTFTIKKKSSSQRNFELEPNDQHRDGGKPRSDELLRELTKL